MSEPPRGMKTNGIGQFCDWLNHTVSMADDPEVSMHGAGQPRADGYVAPRRPDAAEWNRTLRVVEAEMRRP